MKMTAAVMTRGRMLRKTAVMTQTPLNQQLNQQLRQQPAMHQIRIKGGLEDNQFG
ncbi:Nucleoside triphosphate pyrophosphohydrolase MazG [Sesbania bispinosa]|nr:Nucleoside triphosphate pyrophosphohydrolase MazG [Sesbania bispinosa]